MPNYNITDLIDYSLLIGIYLKRHIFLLVDDKNHIWMKSVHFSEQRQIVTDNVLYSEGSCRIPAEFKLLLSRDSLCLFPVTRFKHVGFQSICSAVLCRTCL